MIGFDLFEKAERHPIFTRRQIAKATPNDCPTRSTDFPLGSFILASFKRLPPVECVAKNRLQFFSSPAFFVDLWRYIWPAKCIIL